MNFLRTLGALAALTVATMASSQAASLSLNGGWSEFAVDADAAGNPGWIDNDFAPLSFSFTLTGGAVLRVVDAGFAGDTFGIFLVGPKGGEFVSSTVPIVEYADTLVGTTDFDAALANPAYSRFEKTIGPGQYTVSGVLLQSVQIGGQPLGATLGGISLVPEPASIATLLAGLSLLTLVLRRGAKK